MTIGDRQRYNHLAVGLFAPNEIAPALRRDRSFALHPFHNVLGDRDRMLVLWAMSCLRKRE